MIRALDKAAFETGSTTASAEINSIIFGARPLAERNAIAADICRGLLTDAAGTLACIEGVAALDDFLISLRIAIATKVPRMGVAALSRKD
jgi:hypothetical protein